MVKRQPQQPVAPLLTLSDRSSKVFAECRRKFQLSYLERLEPLSWPEDSEALSFGRLLADTLERWNDGWSLDSILTWLAAKESEAHTRSGEWSEVLADRFCRMRALIRGYSARYQLGSSGSLVPSFIGIELEFDGPIVNPASGVASRLLAFGGRMDGLLLIQQSANQSGWFETGPGLWVYEAKSTSKIDGTYLEKLWNAQQTGLYAAYVQRLFGVPVRGVIYDLIEKPAKTTHRRVGETEEEFRLRYQRACSENKSGKSSITRQIPETWQQYEDRLFEHHFCKGETFRREHILMDGDRIREAERQLWMQGQDMLAARQRDLFYRNRESCRKWGGVECEYLSICDSGDSQAVIENGYRKKGERKTHHAMTTESLLVQIQPVAASMPEESPWDIAITTNVQSIA